MCLELARGLGVDLGGTWHELGVYLSLDPEVDLGLDLGLDLGPGSTGSMAVAKEALASIEDLSSLAGSFWTPRNVGV